MSKPVYVATMDLGKTNFHAAAYKCEPKSCSAPVRVTDVPSVANENYTDVRDNLTVERLDEASGATRMFLASLPAEVRANLKMIVLDSHGAAGYVFDKDMNPVFPIDYDHDSSSARSTLSAMGKTEDERYMETGSPKLSAGINWGTAIAYLCTHFPGEMKRHAANFNSLAGYVASRLTGENVATDLTHLANHGYACDITTMKPSSTLEGLASVFKLEILDSLANVRKQAYIPVGTLKDAKKYGIPEDCQVISIAHDTSMVAELARIGGIKSFDNSGTWSCHMVPGGRVQLRQYMKQWDFTVNADIYGSKLPTTMFRGGQMWGGYMKLGGQEAGFDPEFDYKLLLELLGDNVRVMPAFMDGNGPYKHDPKKDPTSLPARLANDPVALAHATHLALAIQSAYADATVTRTLKENAEISDILKHPRGNDMLIAGPASRGLSAAIMNTVIPKDLYAVTDETPVNLTAALIGMAVLEGVSPKKLMIDPDTLPIREIEEGIPQERVDSLLIRYARDYEIAARRAIE